MSEDEDRLARWARLKSEGARPKDVAPAPEPLEADEAFLAALPKIEAIDAATDIRGFLRKGVPDALRNAALARAWLADPAIRDRIPDAIDYAEDYNAPHRILGWGEACPAQAQDFVERALDPFRRDAATEPKIVAEGGVEAAPSPAPAVGTDASQRVDPPASENRARITKNRLRHGGALPADA